MIDGKEYIYIYVCIACKEKSQLHGTDCFRLLEKNSSRRIVHANEINDSGLTKDTLVRETLRVSFGREITWQIVSPRFIRIFTYNIYPQGLRSLKRSFFSFFARFIRVIELLCRSLGSPRLNKFY